jgi:hypothetical protein
LLVQKPHKNRNTCGLKSFKNLATTGGTCEIFTYVLPSSPKGFFPQKPFRTGETKFKVLRQKTGNSLKVSAKKQSRPKILAHLSFGKVILPFRSSNSTKFVIVNLNML